MIALLLVGAVLIFGAAAALDEDPDARWFDGLLFVLILIGIVHAKRKREEDSED